MVVAPTGAGKTVIGGAIAARHLALGGRVLFVAHTREIIDQTARRFGSPGRPCAVFMGARSDTHAPLTVASVQTLASRIARNRPVPAASLVIVDEAHHIRAGTYGRMIEHYQGKGARVVGLTATPVRADGKGLAESFSELVQTVTVSDLIDAGHLARFRYFAAVPPDLAGVRKVAGDWDQDQLAQRMSGSKILGDVVESWTRHIKAADGEPRRTALLFAVSIRHSLLLRDAFLAARVEAVHVDGTTPARERDEVFAALAEKAVDVVCNVSLVCEGYDCPSLDGVILARPTQSLGLARQQVGRVLRPPGPVVILDHAGIFAKHGRPDDPIMWKLTADKDAASVDREAWKSCPECAELIRSSARECACGWFHEVTAEAARPEEEHGAGKMVEIDTLTSGGAPPREKWIVRELFAIHQRGHKLWSILPKYEDVFLEKPPFAQVRRAVEAYDALALGECLMRRDGECRFCPSHDDYWKKQSEFRARAKINAAMKKNGAKL